MSNFTLENELLTTSVINILGVIIYCCYPFSMAWILNDHLPDRVKLNYNLYLVNCSIWFTAYSSITILSKGQRMIFEGWAAIPMFYAFYAFIHFFAFPARTLKSIELKKETNLGDYIVDSFLLLFLPLGIWILHPKIQQVLEQEEIMDEK